MQPEALRFHDQPLYVTRQQATSFGSRGSAANGDDRPDPEPHLEQTVARQLGDRLLRRVRVDLQCLAELAHRGEGLRSTKLT